MSGGFACGDWHGEAEFYCERYFCEEHRRWVVRKDYSGKPEEARVCAECALALFETGEWAFDPEEAVIYRKEAA